MCLASAAASRDDRALAAGVGPPTLVGAFVDIAVIAREITSPDHASLLAGGNLGVQLRIAGRLAATCATEREDG